MRFLILTIVLIMTTGCLPRDNGPVIRIETEFGPATISGPAAEYVLQSAFPVVLE